MHACHLCITYMHNQIQFHALKDPSFTIYSMQMTTLEKFVATQIASTLVYMHSSSPLMIHGDIKVDKTFKYLSSYY